MARRGGDDVYHLLPPETPLRGYKPPEIRFQCVRCKRLATVKTEALRKRFGDNVTVGTIALELAGTRCGLARVDGGAHCSTQAEEPPVWHYATLYDALHGHWRAVLRGRRGQPATPIFLNPSGAFAIGAEIGWTHIELVLLNMVGERLGHYRRDYSYPDAVTIFDELADNVQALLAPLSPAERLRMCSERPRKPRTSVGARRASREPCSTHSLPLYARPKRERDLSNSRQTDV